MRPRDIWSKVAATILLAVGWLHELLKPVGEWLSVSMLSFWEETARSFVRAWFISAGRYINATSAALLSLLSFRSYSRTQRRQAAQRSKAWESWWRDTRGTFNALLEREGFSPPEVTAKEVPGSQQNGVGPRLPPPPTAPPRRRWGIWRRASSGSDVLVPQGTNLFSSTAQSLTDATARRGLLEDVRLSIEIGLTKTFAALRRVIRAAFFLEKVPESPNVRGSLKRKRFGPGTARMREEQAAFTASDAILRAGYPLEEHSVTTADGYVLQMHRIPRRGARDVVLFQHGVLDTSLGWVALGPGGSAAFAAHDAGFDVWLANTRANPPRLNVNPERKGAKYWRYSANDLALDDLPAQINHIHRIKIGELTGAPSGAGGGQGTRAGGLARSATEACLPKDVKPTADDEGHGGTAGRGLAAVVSEVLFAQFCSTAVAVGQLR